MGVRARAILVTGMLLGLVAAGWPGAAHAAAQPQIVVTTEAHVDTSPADLPRLNTTLTVAVPSRRHEVELMATNQTGEADYRTALQRFLTGLGVLDPVYTVPFGERPPTPRPRVENGRTTVTFHTTAELNGPDASAGPWVMSQAGDNVALDLRAVRVPKGVRWKVHVDSKGMPVTATDPVPSVAMQRDEANWTFDSQPKEVAVHATVEPPIAARSLLWGDEARTWGAVRDGLSIFVPACVYFVLVLVGTWWFTRKGVEADQLAPLRAVSSILLVIWILGGLFWVVNRLASAADQAYFAVPLLITVAVFAVAARKRAYPDTRLRWRALLFAIDFLLLLECIYLFERLGDAFTFEPDSFPDHDGMWWSIAAIVAAFAICWWFLRGAAHWALALAGRSPESRLVRFAIAAPIAAVSLIAAGQWVWASASGWDIDRDQLTLGYNGGVERFSPTGFESWLLRDLPYYPAQILGSIGSTLALLVAIGLLRVLYSHSGHPRPGRYLPRDGVSPLIVSFLFAAFFSGLGGGLFGFTLPIAFVVSFALMLLVLGLRPCPPEPAPPAQPVATAPTATGSDASATLREWRLRIGRRLRTSLKRDEPGERLESPDAPIKYGPTDSWWENGRIAFRIGLPIALLPTGFEVWQQLHDTPGLIHGPTAPSGWLVLANTAISTLAGWGLAAFIFGALYSSLWFKVGAAKGLLLGGIDFVATALAEAPPGHQLGIDWLLVETLVLVYFALVGVCIDQYSLRERNARRTLVEVYDLRSVGGVVRFVAPIAVSAVLVVTQFAAGNKTEAITEALRGAPQAFPNSNAPGSQGQPGTR